MSKHVIGAHRRSGWSKGPRALQNHATVASEPQGPHNRRVFMLVFILTSVLVFAPTSLQSASPSQYPSTGADEIVAPRLLFALDRAYRGGELRAALVGEIKHGWHVNSNKPNEEFLIPTSLRVDSLAGVTIERVIFPPGLMRTFEFSETPLSVYDGEFVVGLQLRLSEKIEQRALQLSGILTYQACNDVSCLPPVDKPFRAEITLADRTEAANLINTEVFSKIEFGDQKEPVDKNEVGALIEHHGFGVSLFFIFLAGLALNLTPCVYPMIPITVSYFGGQTPGSPSRQFGYAAVYVLGMALIYSALGVVAAVSGSLFGAALQSPPVLIAIATVMLILALSMFGVYEIRVPSFLMQIAGGSRPGYFGSFFMGLTVGFVAAPCIGPFVLALLTYVGASGNPVMGFAMFFTLALGLGLPFLLLGTFSGLLQQLPRSGVWMVWVKKVFGFILVAMAGYFLLPILPEPLKFWLLPTILIVGGIYVGLLDRSSFNSPYFVWIKRLAAVTFAAVALWLAIPEQSAQAGSEWHTYSADVLAQAQQQSKPVIIDFTAEWCLACKELEKHTFVHREVLDLASQFVLLRADLTHYGSEPVRRIREAYGIMGLPTVIFLDRQGNEVSSQRVVGFVDGKNFSARMRAVLENSVSMAE